MSVKNLEIFTDMRYFPQMATSIEKNKIALEYWRDNIFVRIHKNIESGYMVVYFEQKGDFAIVGDLIDGAFNIEFRRMSTEEWYEVTKDDFADAYEFYRQY